MKTPLTWKKKLSALLCVAVLATSIPSIAFATEDKSALSEQSVEAIQEETTAADIAFAEAEAPSIESASVDSSVDNDELFEEYVNQLFFGADTSASTSSQKKLRKSSARANLSEYEQIVYDTLKEGAAAIASGERSSSIFEIPITNLGGQMYTAEELGLTSILNDSGKLSDEAKAAIAKKSYVDVSAVIHALMADCPYELYWFDKTSGYSWGYPSISYTITAAGPAGYKQNGYLTIYMAVAGEYSDGSYMTIGGKNLLISADTSVTGAAASAAANAQDIIAENASLSDYDKLTTYKDTICDLTDYNQSAVDNDTDYGNPWQLIWVFDGKADTTVVCEGYSKAFQYLCDQSDFTADIECITVTGTMSGGTGAGGHMWNIVHMDDGQNYMVDVTNCDAGTIGYPDSLFLKGYTQKNTVEGEVETADGTVSYTTSEYIFTPSSRNISYVYDYDTVDLYSVEDLTLSQYDYVAGLVYDDDQHYLVFASDRHGNTTGNDTQIRTAMTGVQNEYPSVEYVSLIGDMVGAGGSDAPAYDCSIVYDEVHEVFPNLDPDHVSIVWGTHDAGVTDNNHYNMVYGATAGSSGLMYTGKNQDGSVAYYIYAIAYYDMNNASNAASAADAFKTWANSADVDKTAPIIVLCHMPLHYARRDNTGAAYWSNAFNQIATGETTSNANAAFSSGNEIVRDVIYLHGHNHTNESNKEYYVNAKSQMNIQSGSSSLSTHIYYTYATAGYMQSTNKNATLISINDSDITLTKYQNGNAGNAYSSGTWGDTDTTSATHLIGRAAPSPGITISPETLNLTVGSSETLSIAIDNTEDATVTWTSSDNNVATVSYGSVTAVSTGNATITASITVDGNTYSATCEVSVYCEHVWGDATYTWSADNKTVIAEHTCSVCNKTTTETVDAVIDEKAASCTEKGVTTYTAAFAGDGFETQTKTFETPALGHDYKTEVTAPTCIENGFTTHTCTRCGESYVDNYVDALGHNWDTENIVWTWSKDYSSASAMITCKNDVTHQQTVNATITSATTAATCETAGKKVYTATATFEGKAYTDTREVTIPASGHDWGEVTYTWSDDYKTVQAKRVCQNDSSHIEQEFATTTAAVTKAATCEEKGETTYTATFKNTAFAKQTKTVANIDAIGHDWDTKNISWIWSSDNSSAAATITCANDATHKQTVNATVTSKATTATCETAGKTVYTATVSFAGSTYTDTKEVAIPATGHKWSEVTYTWSDDYKIVTATRVCANDANHVENETVDATYKVTTPATETEAGIGTWTSAAFKNNAFAVQTKEVMIPPYGFKVTYEWIETADGYNVKGTAIPNDTSADTITETVSATYAVTTTPTCTEAGIGTWTSTEFKNSQFAVQTKEVEISALDHDWSDATYTWSVDYKTVTAKRVCKNDDSHIEQETAATTATVTKAATCTEKGETTYTATFKNAAFAKQTKTVADIVATGHDWDTKNIEWTWSADNGSATATITCANDSTHKQTVNATVTSKTTAATCETAGKIVYTATVDFEGSTYTETKEVTIPATGHDWGDVTYTWSDDYKTVQAKRVCKNDSSHIEQEFAATTAAVTKVATCEEKGETTYTVTFKNEAFTEQTKIVANIVALGHDYELTGWTWTSDNASAIATFTCKNDSAHKQTVNATMTSKTTAATCETAGKTVYTATATFGGKTYTDTKEVVTLATGHKWSEVTYTWSDDYKKLTATRTCTNDASHVETETVDTTYKVTTPATETEAGVGTWTSAAFKNSAFAVQTKEVTIPPYGFKVTYEWIETADGYNVKGTAVPNDTSADTITETISATYAFTTEPTCTAKGIGTWTSAAFQNSQFAVQTKEVEIAALGHDYKKVVTAPTCTEKGYTTHTCTRCGDSFVDSYVDATGHDWDAKNIDWIWTNDYSSATATFTCKNDSAHMQTIDAIVTSKTIAATCEAAGKTIYTATATFEGQAYTDTKEVTIPAIGHKWNNVTYTWSDDYKKVTATRTCTNDANHVETETVDAIYKVTKAATGTEAGIGTWTSAAFKNSAFAVQTKEVTIPPYGFKITYEWIETAEGYNVKGTAVPNDTSADTITETVSATYAVTTEPTCSAKGIGIWTSAAFKNSLFAIQTKEVEIAALGHDYKTEVTTPTCTEKGYTTHTCTRCGDSYVDSYVDTIDHTWDQGTVTTEPTYLKTGVRTYTCTSCGETKTETIPKKTATKKWIQEEGEWYYFNADSEILTNGWAKDSTGWCWMGADGKITKSKWITYKGEWYYLKANGYMAANEWTKDSTGWMWMDGSGKTTKNKWIQYKNEWYYLKANGYMAANEWAKDSKGWMWMDDSGKITKSKWITYKGEWYYLKANGYMAANEYASDSTKTYWMGSDGKIS